MPGAKPPPPGHPDGGRPARRGGVIAGFGPHAAHRGLRSGLAIRAALSLAGAIVLLAVGVGLARRGIVDHTFPPFIKGQTDAVITHYSGPWLVAAVVVGATAGLLAVASVTDWWRRRLIGTDLKDSHTDLGQ